MAKFSTVKEWRIKVSEDIQITLMDGDTEIGYKVSMEEAILTVGKICRLIRQYPNETYFQVNFGGKQHGFEGNIEAFIADAQKAITECMMLRLTPIREFIIPPKEDEEKSAEESV